MSFVGNLNIFLDTDDNCVRNAAVKASSEVSVEKIIYRQNRRGSL